ncbi:hypothetical protein R3P38DRAFT_3600766 [Favolaschia claudopus]|uniref:Uncharacterized protein n=1 Tax=Favolaschia claudopus TaxID=2862362 RepID=A0AAV9ZSK0_9AGAR
MSEETQDTRRGRSSVMFVFVRQPLGTPILGQRSYAFSSLLQSRSSRLASDEKVDRVYRGEMTPEEQRAYIEARQRFPLAHHDESFHQQNLLLLNGPHSVNPALIGPVTPTPEGSDSDSESEYGSNFFYLSDSSAEDQHTAVTSSADDDGNLSDSSAEDDRMLSSPAAAPSLTITPAAALSSPTDSDVDSDDDSLFGPEDIRATSAASSPSRIHIPSGYDLNSFIGSDDEIDQLMSSPLSSPLTFPTVNLSNYIDSDGEIDELMSSPSVAAADLDTTTQFSPMESLGSIIDTKELLLSAAGPPESFSGSEIDIDELMSSPTGGLGYPYPVESFTESPTVDNAQNLAPNTPARSETSLALEQLLSTPFTNTPARSETSLALEQLLSTPFTPRSDAGMGVDPLFFSPGTPNATPDTSMETDDPFSLPSTPNAGPSFKHLSPTFPLGSPFRLQGEIEDAHSSLYLCRLLPSPYRGILCSIWLGFGTQWALYNPNFWPSWRETCQNVAERIHEVEGVAMTMIPEDQHWSPPKIALVPNPPEAKIFLGCTSPAQMPPKRNQNGKFCVPGFSKYSVFGAAVSKASLFGYSREWMKT